MNFWAEGLECQPRPKPTDKAPENERFVIPTPVQCSMASEPAIRRNPFHSMTYQD